MNAALWISKTGLSAQDAEMSAIANNIANVNTTGFKRDRVMFQDLFYQTQEAPGAMLDQNNIMPTGLQFGSGVRIVGTQKTFTEGNVETTDNAMNVAIMGQGFLQVQKANGDIAYTRDGNLQVNADGVLTNSQGLPLQPEIDVPAGATTCIWKPPHAVSRQKVCRAKMGLALCRTTHWKARTWISSTKWWR